MDYYVVSIQDAQLFHHLDELKASSVRDFGCCGIEEFGLNEEQVDFLLGERSYSGGDIEDEVLFEVESRVMGAVAAPELADPIVHFYFSGTDSGPMAGDFQNFVVKNFPSLRTSMSSQAEQDWNEEWKKHYAPIEITPEFFIVPSFSKDEWEDNPVKKIYINAGMGFGTGSHETTFLCLKLLLEVKAATQGAVQTVLDFGCGSSILGLSAVEVLESKSPLKVDLYDIDEKALENSRENIQLNFAMRGLEIFRLLLPEARTLLAKNYHLVFANILKNVLAEENQNLTELTAVGGHLILSGLLNNQVEEIKQLYLADGRLILRNHLSKNDWSALLFQRAR